MQNPNEQILVATTMNFTADLVAQELFKIEMLKKKVLRLFSSVREDIFNIKIRELPEYSVLYKMLYESEDTLNEMTAEHTEIAQNTEEMDQDDLFQKAKYQIEYYFGQTNYERDIFLRDMESPEGRWIDLRLINEFRKMQKFGLGEAQLYQIMEKSSVVEVRFQQVPIKQLDNKTCEVIHTGDTFTRFFVRKKILTVTEKVNQLLGFNLESVKTMTKDQFRQFIKHKDEFEQRIIKKFPCIVTTIGVACTRNLVERRFKRVVIDEATMVKEHEAFLATQHAE